MHDTSSLAGIARRGKVTSVLCSEPEGRTGNYWKRTANSVLPTTTALVALVTVHAVVDVPTHIGMVEVGRVVISMASSALEDRIITRVGMAGSAHAIRISVIGREVRVVERGPSPGRCGVARGAGRGEAGGCMVRVRRPVVVRLMAAHASGWQRRVVIVHVAHHAGHGGGGVETGEREGRVVVIEGRACPVRRAVARIARRREAGGGVRRRVGVVVIRLVARDARRIGRRQAVIAVHVTSGARHRAVETRQREAGRRVIEGPVTPIRGGVALVARGREACLRVVRIVRAVVIRHVALGACSTGQAVVIVHVALRAGHRRVETSQREARRRVIESRGSPVGRAMACLAGLWESSSRVWRIIRAIEIRQVAADASRVRAGQVVIAVHVALRALQRRVESSERESRG